MPLYDFRCATCGEFEAWRSLAELDQVCRCPICAAEARRLLSAPNLNLNSSGLSLRRAELPEPQLVKRDRDPQPTRNQPAHGRPWMIGH